MVSLALNQCKRHFYFYVFLFFFFFFFFYFENIQPPYFVWKKKWLKNRRSSAAIWFGTLRFRLNEQTDRKINKTILKVQLLARRKARILFWEGLCWTVFLTERIPHAGVINSTEFFTFGQRWRIRFAGLEFLTQTSLSHIRISIACTPVNKFLMNGNIFDEI